MSVVMNYHVSHFIMSAISRRDESWLSYARRSARATCARSARCVEIAAHRSYFCQITVSNTSHGIAVADIVILDSDGIILFSTSRELCSYWSFIRRGAIASSKLVIGVVRNVCRSIGVELERVEPCILQKNGLFKLNIKR